MARELSERVKDWMFWVEQVGHLAIGGSAIAVSYILGRVRFPGWQIVAGFVTAVVWVVVREVIDGIPIESIGDTIVDSLFTIAGGLGFGGLVFALERMRGKT